MSFPLALVTGAAQRLGKGIAQYLGRRGYAILLHFNSSEDEAQKTAEEIRTYGVPVQLVQADLTNPEEIQNTFSVLDEWITARPNEISKFSLLVNSAATMVEGRVYEVTLEDWNSTINLNLRAPFFCAQESAKRMAHGGSIINISDIAANKTWSGHAAYITSKAGLEAMTRVLAKTYAPRIRVNGIAPGLVLPNAWISVEEWERLTARLPLKRVADLEEITATLGFLLDNEYIIGEIISVDGGYSLLS
jgi:pteridine reductase